MIFKELEIAGVYSIELERHEDERGFFARTFCKNEFAVRDLHTDFVQCNLSYNKKSGTLRGIHYQTAPHEEVKIVSCITGAIYDVVLDIREDSDTYGKWVGVELSARNHRMLYIPGGVAHGFQTLEDNSTVFYQMSEFYHPECARGIRWDDEKFQIKWRDNQPILSEKDSKYNLMKTPVLESQTIKYISENDSLCVAGYLRILSKEDLKNRELIQSMVRWRRQAANSFFSSFEVTEAGTRKWLEASFFGKEQKKFFWIEDRAHRVLGHIAFINIDYQKGEAEIDSVLRGEKSPFPGFFKGIVGALLAWGKEQLSLKKYTLHVFLDNQKAINLYKSLGFQEKSRCSTVCLRENGIVQYIPLNEKNSVLAEVSDRVIIAFDLKP